PSGVDSSATRTYKRSSGEVSLRPSGQIAAAVAEALRALSICAPGSILGVPVAIAQTVDSPALGADIPAQPLAQALAEFARQTGLQLVYVSGVVRDQQSHVVAAGLGSQDALVRLLQGTGLRFQFLTAHSVRILDVTPRQIAGRTFPGDYPSEVL